MKSASNSRAWVQFWQSNKPTTQTRVIQPLHAPFPRGLFLDSCRVLSHNSDLMDAKLIGFFNDLILYFGAPSAEEISSMGVCVCVCFIFGVSKFLSSKIQYFFVMVLTPRLFFPGVPSLSDCSPVEPEPFRDRQRPRHLREWIVAWLRVPQNGWLSLVESYGLHFLITIPAEWVGSIKEEGGCSL